MKLKIKGWHVTCLISAIIFCSTSTWGETEKTGNLWDLLIAFMPNKSSFSASSKIYHTKYGFYDDQFIQKSSLGPSEIWQGKLDDIPEKSIIIQSFYDSFIRSLNSSQFSQFDSNDIVDFRPVLESELIDPDSYSDVNAVGRLMTNKLGDAILSILNDPAYQESQKTRVKIKDSRTFFQTKGRSNNYTLKELDRLMNSTYIYLPYIQSIDRSKNNHKITLDISNGIIWYKVMVDRSNKISIKPVVIIRGNQSIQYKLTDSNRTDVIRDKISDATRALFLKLRSVQLFQFAGRVSTVSNRTYTVDLPSRYSQLDDMFYLKEATEFKFGLVKYKTVGVLRVINSDTKNLKLYQQLGASRSRGGWAVETNRENKSASLGYYVRQTAMPLRMVYGNGAEISDTIHTMSGFQLSAGYNIGPSISISQLFIGLDVRFSEGSGDVLNLSSRDYGVYAEKKFWWRNHGLSTLVGLAQLSLKTQYDYYSINTTAMRYGLGYHLMVTSKLLLTVHWVYESQLTKIRAVQESASNPRDYLAYSPKDINNTQVHLGLTIDF